MRVGDGFRQVIIGAEVHSAPQIVLFSLGREVNKRDKGTGGLRPFAKGARIRANGGKLTVTDGPFIESKEVVGGYGILQAKYKEEAIELGKAFMNGNQG